MLDVVVKSVPLTLLQSVDVLSVHAEQQILLMQHADEIMDVIRTMVARVQLLGQRKERTRVFGEVIDVEDGFGIRNVVLFQICIQTRAWGPE